MSFSKCFKKKKRFLSHQSQSLFESKIGTFSFTMWLSVKPLFFVNTKVFSQYKIIYISRRYSRENINWHGKIGRYDLFMRKLDPTRTTGLRTSLLVL